MELVSVGGLPVKDDPTPGWEGPDPLREVPFGDPRLVAVEILTTPSTAVVLATRVR